MRCRTKPREEERYLSNLRKATLSLGWRKWSSILHRLDFQMVVLGFSLSVGEEDVVPALAALSLLHRRSNEARSTWSYRGAGRGLMTTGSMRNLHVVTRGVGWQYCMWVVWRGCRSLQRGGRKNTRPVGIRRAAVASIRDPSASTALSTPLLHKPSLSIASSPKTTRIASPYLKPESSLY